jgi:oligopeptide transport system ATP-binding protein
VQAQIMDLLTALQAETNMALILITHDLGVVAGVADHIAVMYAGRVVEMSPIRELYARPAHPYTKGLLESIPRRDGKGEQLVSIPGMPPNLQSLPRGCAFSPRCPYVIERCTIEPPPLYQISPDRDSACFRFEELLNDN